MDKKLQARIAKYAKRQGMKPAEATTELLTKGLNRQDALDRYNKSPKGKRTAAKKSAKPAKAKRSAKSAKKAAKVARAPKSVRRPKSAVKTVAQQMTGS